MSSQYNMMEMMICTAARFLENGKTVAVGTGAPCAAAMLAQKTHAPDLVVVFEAGGIAPQLPQMPISVGDSRTFFRAVMAAGMCEMMTTCSRGLVDYAFLGGAQIDAYGNLNSTIVGDYAQPKVRFPGSGGANDFASMCWRTMIMTVHNQSRFVEKVDFVTSPGWGDGPDWRAGQGLTRGGPAALITSLGVFRFPAGRAVLTQLHPGVELERVRRETGWELAPTPGLTATPAPTPDELAIIRRYDPQRFWTG